MRFHQLDLNLLVALDALIEERSVSAAAERVFLSQSAMSGALARLREALGDELLVPQGRGMMPTPRALELAGHVKEVLAQIEREILSRRAFEPSSSARSITIMASDYAVAVLLAPAIERIHKLAPNIRFDILPMGSDPVGLLERGDIQLLILPESFASPDHPKTVLIEDDYVCVACAKNPIPADGLSEAQFWELPHVTVEFERSRSVSPEEALEAKYGRKLRRNAKVSAYGLAPFLVAGSNRLAIMHARHAEIFAPVLGLKVLAPPIDIPGVIEIIQWKNVNSTDDGLMWVADEIVKACAQIGQ